MTLKERVENSPVVYLLGALLTGFLGGLGTYEAILRIARLDTVRQGTYVNQDELARNYVRRQEVTQAPPNSGVSSNGVTSRGQGAPPADPSARELEIKDLGAHGSDSTLEASQCPQGKWDQQDADICVQLQNCKRQGDTVTCSLELTSLDADRMVNIGPHGGWHRNPTLHDELGSAYELRSVGIGNRADSEVVHPLVANIHTPCRLEFGDVNQKARQASLLKIALYLGHENQDDWVRKDFEFRNVPLE